MCRPQLGRHEPTNMLADTRPILYRHSATTQPSLGRHSADTFPTLGQHYAHLASSYYWVLSSLLYWERLSVAVVLFWPLTPAIFMYFFQLCFSSSSPLYTTLVTFGCSSIWGLLLSEARYFRGAKDDIKSWYDCALFLPHGWVFQFQTSWYFTTLRGISNTFPVAECVLFEMAAVWAASLLYQHTSIGNGLFFCVTCW